MNRRPFVKPPKEAAGTNWTRRPVPTLPWPRAWQLASPADAQEMKRPGCEALPTTYPVVKLVNILATTPNIAHSEGLPAQSPDYKFLDFLLSQELPGEPFEIKAYYSKSILPPSLQGLCISCHLITAAARERDEQSSVLN